MPVPQGLGPPLPLLELCVCVNVCVGVTPPPIFIAHLHIEVMRNTETMYAPNALCTLTVLQDEMCNLPNRFCCFSSGF